MKFCQYLAGTIVFRLKDILACFSACNDIIPNYLKNDNNVQNFNFAEKKQNLINLLNSDEINKLNCAKCCNIKDVENVDIASQKYNLICIYFENEPFTYNLEDIIQNLYNQELIDREKLIIKINFNEIEEEQLKKVVEVFYNNGFNKIDFRVDNIIKYHHCIEKILSEGKASLCIKFNSSISNVKQIDRLKQMKKNLKTYIEKAQIKHTINVHYVLTKTSLYKTNVIKEFLDFMNEFGVSTIGLEFENINELLNSTTLFLPLKEKTAGFFIDFFKLCRKYNFYMDMKEQEQNIILRRIFKACNLIKKTKKNTLFAKLKRKFFK
jgi:hypothetical protein